MSIPSKEKTLAESISRTCERVQRGRSERRCNALRVFCFQQLCSYASSQFQFIQYSLHRRWSIYVPCHHSSPSPGEHFLDPLSHYLAIKLSQTHLDTHRQTYLWQLANRDENLSVSLGEGPLDLPQSLIFPSKCLHFAFSLLSFRQIDLFGQTPWLS